MTYGILGLGSIGSRHAINLKFLDRDVIAFDPSQGRMDWAHSQGIVCTPSRDSVLENSQAIVVCSPNEFHLEDLKDAIAANCHIFAEKPLAHVAEGVDNLLQEASEKGLSIFVGLNLRFHPAVMAAKALMDQSAIGQPHWAILQSSHYLPDWRPDHDYRQGYTANPISGGVLFDIIHEFDLANHLLGPAKTLTAAARNTGAMEISSEDCADIILCHDSGVHSNLHLDYVSRPTRRFCELGGSEGNLRIDIVKREVTLTNCEGAVMKNQVFDSTTSTDDYVAEMSAFIECVEENASPPCDGYAALEILKQVISARQLCGLPAA